MIDLRHPFAVLAQRWARQIKAGKKIEELDLFGAVSGLAESAISNTGLPGLSTWLMVALLYLKHTFNERDEDVILLRLGETPTWQYFSGNEYFEHRWPCDQTQLGCFRNLLGEEGVEELLARTMEVAVNVIRKAPGNRVKLYSWHEPEVECIRLQKVENPTISASSSVWPSSPSSATTKTITS